MTATLIEDFRHGLDTRKSALTAIGGSLQRFDNAVLTPGGEIEKRRAFVNEATLPAGCFGLFGATGQLHTFGTVAPPSLPTLPVAIYYHQLQAPASPIVRVVDVEFYQPDYWVTALLQNGTYQSWYNGALRANGGTQAVVHRSKVYRTDGKLLRFSAIGDPTSDTNTPTTPGGGFVDVSAQDSNAESLNAVALYYDQLALFARHSTQLWDIDPDPSLNRLKQVVAVGTTAPHSALPFGAGEVLFLSDSGIRSLRSLNFTMAAGLVDVGSPVDNLVKVTAAQDSAGGFYAQAVITPMNQRYVLAIGQTMYVLSFFPSAKISAWSTWTVPFVVTDWAVVGTGLYCLDANRNVYLYGGTTGETYDSSTVTIRTPHMPFDKPTVLKKMNSVAAIATGSWTIKLGMKADDTEAFETIANAAGLTVVQHRLPAAGRGTHAALELTSSAAGPATISALAMNYQLEEKL